MNLWGWGWRGYWSHVWCWTCDMFNKVQGWVSFQFEPETSPGFVFSCMKPWKNMVQNVTWWKHKLKFWWMDVPVRGSLRISGLCQIRKNHFPVKWRSTPNKQVESEIAMHSLLQKIDVVISLSSLTAWQKTERFGSMLFCNSLGGEDDSKIFLWVVAGCKAFLH